MTLDCISLTILKILQEKARIPNVEVARRVNMAPSAVLERIRKLENQGYINGYEVILNPEKFGRSLIAFVDLAVDDISRLDDAGQRLAALDEVQEVHLLSGNTGFRIKVRVEDTASLAAFLASPLGSLEGLRPTATSVALSTYKETSQIPLSAKECDPCP
ncbi:Lrp/AsnC family transcriptional regulator [Desulfoluna butyratoxydans]|uniref:Dimeric alpha-beta barrel n=1 Tax=Desulfoluna butyratoxydans TaxID=231438 RepID=A0A4U8YJD3_9BACT|nr:Lrp/AsnC family transcriptional regulator [Desulfoluna butyratoxydans]VFQ43530.1 dimeric alpha-beta barrel [Desulfoluna butyratoxydans]